MLKSTKTQASLLAGFIKVDRITWLLRSIVFGLMLWLASWYFIGDAARYLGYVHAGGLLYSFLAILVALLLTWKRDWVSMLLALALGITLLFMVSGTNVAASQEKALGSNVRLMSASLRGLNRDMKGSAEYLARYNADIIGLQEVHDAKAFRDALASATGKPWYFVRQNNLALMSVYPLEPIVDRVTGVLRVFADIPQRKTAIWTLRAPKSFNQPILNTQFYRKLQSAIRDEKPAIVMGDFNASRWNSGYKVMAKEMQNAQTAAGFGPGSTFPGPARRSGLLGAFVRIDHIFAARDIRIVNAFTGKAYAKMDHHPVIADIRLGAAETK